MRHIQIKASTPTMARNLLSLSFSIGGLTPSEAQNNPCILVYAREDGYEHDTSWVAEGMMLSLLLKREFKALPEKATFLIVPLLDPDGAVHSLYKNIGSSFLNNQASTPESIAWLGWFRDWVNQGNRLDVVINLHNTASRESDHIECALVEPKTGRNAQCKLLNKAIIEALKKKQYLADVDPWLTGYAVDRMGGFLQSYFGNVHLAYEVNSQNSKQHLTLYRLRAMGGPMAKAIVEHLNSPEARPLMASIDDTRGRRQHLCDRYAALLCIGVYLAEGAGRKATIRGGFGSQADDRLTLQLDEDTIPLGSNTTVDSRGRV